MGLNGLIFQCRELCLYCLPDVIFQYLLGDNGDAPNLSLWPGKGLYILVSIENGEISLLTAIPEKKMLHKERVIVLYGFKFVVAHWRMNDYVTWPFSDNSGQRSDDLLTINDCHDNRVTKFQSANQGANELLRPMPFLRGGQGNIIKSLLLKVSMALNFEWTCCKYHTNDWMVFFISFKNAYLK